MDGLTIGETSARHHVRDHVLRHREDVGALRPARTPAGHRRYDADQEAAIELIKCAKAAGLTLDEIATVLHADPEERAAVVASHLETLHTAALEIKASQRMLQHVRDCRAAQSCPECSHPLAAFRFPSASPERIQPT